MKQLEELFKKYPVVTIRKAYRRGDKKKPMYCIWRRNKPGVAWGKTLTRAIRIFLKAAPK